MVDAFGREPRAVDGPARTRPSSTSRCRARSGSLHFSAGDRQWVITAYALPSDRSFSLGGRLSDLWGRRNGALRRTRRASRWRPRWADAANTFTMLVVARAVQGVFGALLAPAALAALSVTFHRAEEARDGLCHLRRHRGFGRRDRAPSSAGR